MTSIPILPAPHEEERLRAAQQEVQYRCVYEETHPGSGIENVRFKHNPNWRTEPDFFSVSGIADVIAFKSQAGVFFKAFWLFIGLLFVTAQFLGPGVRMLLR